MHRYQIRLDDSPLRQNKAFLKAMYNSQEVEEANKCFDKLDPNKIERQLDEGMTLDSYLCLMNSSFHVILQTGSPSPDKIICASRGTDKQGIDRFLCVIAPFTEKNYEVVAEIFERVYKHELGSIGVLCKD